MTNTCKDCDRLQPIVSGTAPQRPEFQQPTMYDHFPHFQKYKMSKTEEQVIEKRREEIFNMNLNSNFTNWNPPKTRELYEQFSTQDTAQFRQQLKLAQTGERSFLESLTMISDTGTASCGSAGAADDAKRSGKSLKKKVSLLTISRTPVQCPIGACGRTIGVTSVLSHFLRDHTEDLGVQCQEIFGDKRSVLIFDPSTLALRDNVCLGVLAYGGPKERCTTPADRGLCIHNAFLPKPHEHLEAHLPILIMACRTSWGAMMKDKELEETLSNANNTDQHLLVLWLVSVQTTKLIHCTLTVYDKSMTSSRSIITQVRHLNASQNPSDFMWKEPNFLRLNNGEIEILSHNGSECIHMEVMINEYDQ